MAAGRRHVAPGRLGEDRVDRVHERFLVGQRKTAKQNRSLGKPLGLAWLSLQILEQDSRRASGLHAASWKITPRV